MPTVTRRTQLFLEWALFFVALPVGIAVVLPPAMMFPALFTLTGVGLVLLYLTKGFRWGSLWQGMGRISWPLIGGVALGTFVISYVVLALWHPERLFQLLGEGAPRTATGWPIIWIIALFYPLVSALPQELVFRPLFFRRYGALFPRWGLWVNAAVFSLAHLMYWSWVVAAMTFVGGLLFAWSYERRGNFPEAVLAHSVAGVVLFAVGMGTYFYSGNVVRPF